jgi:hypothetical protein
MQAMKSNPSPLERLKTIGFQQVGVWWLDGDEDSLIRTLRPLWNKAGR